jgi:hypothetical protein
LIKHAPKCFVYYSSDPSFRYILFRDDNVTSVKSTPPLQSPYSGIVNGAVGVDIGGLQIQRSFSGSSCGSNGSVNGSSNITAPIRYPGAEIEFLYLF